MPGNYNRIVLAGNLTRDPESKTIGSGSTVCKFSIAVNRKYKETKETTYFDIVAWEKTGEICQQYLRKGSSALVEGRLAIRKYVDKNGAQRQAVEVIIDGMQMLDNKGDVLGDAPSQASASYTYDDLDSEIPF